MASGPTPPPDTWKPSEKRLRKIEIGVQIGAGFAQALLSVATVAAVLIALWVAHQGEQSLKSATQNNLEQAQDSQFSTALTSLGATDVTEQVAGLTMLELDVADRLTPNSTAAFGKPSAYDYYTTALEIYSGFLRSHGGDSMTTTSTAGGTQPFGLGYGVPSGAFPISIQYAADEIRKMLGLKTQVRAVSRVVPGFDLSHDELYEVNFTGLDFSWVRAYMYGIDLRGAILEGVHMSSLDTLTNSHLQCADLKKAQLQGADLQGANLSGANLSQANLQGANLAGADLEGADVTQAIGLPPGAVTNSSGSRIQPSCLMNPSYGDPPPPPNLTPVASPSPTPSSSVIGGKH